jgi:hypothetical protein
MPQSAYLFADLIDALRPPRDLAGFPSPSRVVNPANVALWVEENGAALANLQSSGSDSPAAFIAAIQAVQALSIDLQQAFIACCTLLASTQGSGQRTSGSYVGRRKRARTGPSETTSKRGTATKRSTAKGSTKGSAKKSAR